jgi:3-dehydroquinate synthase
MKSIKVSAERDYLVTFTTDYLSGLIELISDRNTCLLLPDSLSYLKPEFPTNWKVISVDDGENQKTSVSYISTLNHIANLNLSRDAVIVGIGGGATTDLAGFVAATYLRGVDWIAVPTTVAGMVDAAIGGKTGINLDAGKNLAGAFHSPIGVVIDERFLASLPQRDYFAGIAEIVKCGFIADPKILDLLQEDREKNFNEVIWRSIQVKADIVSQDFKESYLRESLNYGHTLGHAIERHSGYELRHGEAISIGLIYAAELSRQENSLSTEIVLRHREILQSLGLPVSYPISAWEELLQIMQSDKKRSNRGLRFVGLLNLGQVNRIEGVAEESLREIYIKAIGE